MNEVKEITLKVCNIAKKAGEYLRAEHASLSMNMVEQKHNHDYVSYVDKQSEIQIVKSLKEIGIEAGFVTEEKTASYNKEDYCWIIDPLDGTTNYIHNYLPYAVSIALMKNGKIILGVVYEVTNDECYYAWRNSGAYMNGNSIRVNSNNNFDKALLCVELPYDHKKYKNFGIKMINDLYGVVGGIRMNGSAATALCYVAAGRIDGWMEKYIGQWDIAAGTIIVEEAGGNVTNFYGSKNYICNNDIVATNGTIHNELLETIKSNNKLLE
jgi:myo-inositol-1(or 4)-monophosphatase